MKSTYGILAILGCNNNRNGNNKYSASIAPRDCGGCAFKKLTHEFEKAVIDAATTGDPNVYPSLLEQYNEDVRALDLTPRG